MEGKITSICMHSRKSFVGVEKLEIKSFAVMNDYDVILARNVKSILGLEASVRFETEQFENICVSIIAH